MGVGGALVDGRESEAADGEGIAGVVVELDGVYRGFLTRRQHLSGLVRNLDPNTQIISFSPAAPGVVLIIFVLVRNLVTRTCS
jgi:hypothetical protein